MSGLERQPASSLSSLPVQCALATPKVTSAGTPTRRTFLAEIDAGRSGANSIMKCEPGSRDAHPNAKARSSARTATAIRQSSGRYQREGAPRIGISRHSRSTPRPVRRSRECDHSTTFDRQSFHSGHSSNAPVVSRFVGFVMVTCPVHFAKKGFASDGFRGYLVQLDLIFFVDVPSVTNRLPLGVRAHNVLEFTLVVPERPLEVDSSARLDSLLWTVH